MWWRWPGDVQGCPSFNGDHAGRRTAAPEPAGRDRDRAPRPRQLPPRASGGLQRRVRTHGLPVTVLSCDNLVANGRVSARLVAEFVAALPASERDELEPYLASVAFPSSMVDRIVPATTDAYREAAARHLGVRDAVPVPAEPFSMWAIEDTFAAGRPAWECGGALFTP